MSEKIEKLRRLAESGVLDRSIVEEAGGDPEKIVDILRREKMPRVKKFILRGEKLTEVSSPESRPKT